MLPNKEGITPIQAAYGLSIDTSNVVGVNSMERARPKSGSHKPMLMVYKLAQVEREGIFKSVKRRLCQ